MFAEHPLLRRFENELDIGEHRLEWTTRGEDFFFRPREAEIETIWCSLRCADFGRQLMFPRQSKKVIHRLKKQIISDYVRRYFPVSEDCELFLHGLAGLVRFQQIEGLLSLTLPKDIAPISALLSLSTPVDLSKIIRNSQQQIERIREAVCCPLQERGWSNIVWSCLLRAMAAIIRQPEHGIGQWQFQIRNRFDSTMFSENFNSGAVTPNKTIYQPFLQCLRSYFPIRIERMIFCTDKGVPREEIWPQVFMSAEMPTAHEKLEALLTWRDFLRGKIPAAQIDELLRPFQ